MARKRIIDPHIWEDPSFNKLTIPVRLLFIGMISHADDEGYLRGDWGSLKRLVFGFDGIAQEQFESWISELKIIKNLCFYENGDSEQYVHFKKWHFYQKQQKDRIQASIYPKCSKCLADATQMLTEVKRSEVKRSEVSVRTQDIKNFFANPESRQDEVEWLLAKGVDSRMVRDEILKFVSYWTEPNRIGKQRWELQPTFEVRRRLATWFSNKK